MDTVPAITVGAPPVSSASFAQPYLNGGSFKSPESPDSRQREQEQREKEHSRDRERPARKDDFNKPSLNKRARDGSPSKDRDRWGSGGGQGKRYNSPGYQDNERGERWRRERDHERARSPARRFQHNYHQREETVKIPEVINGFVGRLPVPEAFDGAASSTLIS